MTQSAEGKNYQNKEKMDTTEIGMIIIGIVLIAVGVFGKIRPDILFSNRGGEKTFGNGFRLFGFSAARLGDRKVAPEDYQRFLLLLFILFGAMLILVCVVPMVTVWETYMSAILLSIVTVIFSVIFFLFWKIILSQNERFKGISFAITMLFCFALIAIPVCYWISILK